MKNLKRTAALALAAALVAGLAACGGDTPLDVMKTAQDKMAEAKSMSYDMRMEMNMTLAGQTMESVTAGKIDYIADPLTMKMEMDMNMGSMGSMMMYMFAEQTDAGYMAYMSLDGQTWMKQALADETLIEQYDAQKSMDLYLNGIEDFKAAGTETVNGSEATRYDGVISKAAMNEVMAASGAADQLAQLGLSREEAEALYQDLGELPVSIWIESGSGLPVKYEMDMTGVMQQMMINMVTSMGGTEEDAASISVDKMLISMTLDNFNEVEEIVIPEEAKNAQEGTLF